MAVVKSLPATKGLSSQLNYLAKEGKTVEELKEGINCTTDNVEQEFNIIKQLHNKTEGKQYYHFTQAFSPEDKITPQKAHELGKEWINNNIKDHQVYMVTHIDKEHIHNHFVINSVNMDNGLKLQISPSKLFEMKKDSNRLCERENLAKINLDRNKGISKTDSEYRLEKKGITPWKDELRQCVDFGRSQTKSIGELKEYLKEHFNIEVRETKNSISYKHPEQDRAVRGNKLGGNYTKEGLLNEFNDREIKSNERGSSREEHRTQGDKPKEQGNTTELGTSSASVQQDINQANGSIGVGIDENREYGTEKTTSDLYDKLREIRSIGDEYSPDARADARARADRNERGLKERTEQLARERIEHQQSELGKSKTVTEQQPNIKPKFKRSHDFQR